MKFTVFYDRISLIAYVIDEANQCVAEIKGFPSGPNECRENFMALVDQIGVSGQMIEVLTLVASGADPDLSVKEAKETLQAFTNTNAARRERERGGVSGEKRGKTP